MKNEKKEALNRKLLAGSIKAAGKKGFYKTATELANKPNVTNPIKLAGWLKAKAAKKGQLKQEHAYKGSHKMSGNKMAMARAMFKKAMSH